MRIQRKRGVGHNVTRSWWALVLGALAIVSVPLLGHHSFAVYYLESDTIEIEGDVVEFQYKNPHAWVQVVGEEAFGRRKAYAAEWTSVSQLERAGITKDTLHVGDGVRIWASPNKNPTDNRVRLKRIERRSDGWKWGQNGRQTR
jgi:uncharacterized protein DUF6152